MDAQRQSRHQEQMDRALFLLCHTKSLANPTGKVYSDGLGTR